jgi:hypothetical protein
MQLGDAARVGADLLELLHCDAAMHEGAPNVPLSPQELALFRMRTSR